MPISDANQINDEASVRQAMNRIAACFAIAVAALAIYAGYLQLAKGGRLDRPQDGYSEQLRKPSRNTTNQH